MNAINNKQSLFIAFAWLTAFLLFAALMIPRVSCLSVKDDSWMFVRYADNLLATGQFSWNRGESPVYGLTSPQHGLFMVLLRYLIPGNVLSAVLIASFVPGLIFLFWVFLRMRKQAPENQLLAISILIPFASAFAFQSGTGMDTQLSLLGIFSYLHFLDSYLKKSTAVFFLLALFTGGLSWWLRPDLILIVAGMPAALMLLESTTRKRLGILLICLLALAAINLLVARLYFGTAVPLPFFAKAGSLYKGDFAKYYAAISRREGLNFILRLSVFGLACLPVFHPRGIVRRMKENAYLYTALGLSAVWILLYTFRVLQIEGNENRFYFPVIALAMSAAWQLPADLNLFAVFRRDSGVKSDRYIAGLAVLCLLIFVGFHIQTAKQSWKSFLNFGRMNFADEPTEIYRAHRKSEWLHLDKVATLPSDLKIASTEIGLPGVVLPANPILDLAGLNSPEISAEGLSPLQAILKFRPDLIYLPHPHYKAELEAITSSPDFLDAYVFIPREKAGADLDIAWLKAGKYSDKLNSIFAK